MAEIRRDFCRRVWRLSVLRGNRLSCCFAALAGFGVIAALFGPIKYGILPDHLARARIAGRQRAGGRRDLRRHPDRHHRRRLGGARRRRCRGICRAGDGICVRLLDCGAVYSADRRRRAAAQDRDQYRRFDRGHDPPSARRPAAVVGRDGDQLVLAGRHRRAVAVAAADQDADRRQRRHRHRLSRAVLDRGRRRLGLGGGDRARAHCARHDARRRCAARRFRARSRLGDLWRGAGADTACAGQSFRIGAGHPRRRRSRRACHRRRAVHRAGLRRGAGLGRRRLSRAHGRGGQCAQCGVHDRRDGRRCDHAEIRRHRAGAFPDDRRGDACLSRSRSGGRCRRRINSSSASSTRGRPSRRRRRDNSPGRPFSPVACGWRAC